MKTIIARIDPLNPDPDIIKHAGELIRNGGLVAFPTETVYGLAANAFDPEAISRILSVKGRPDNKPLPVQVSSIDDINLLVSDLKIESRKLIKIFFPGPLTLVLNASERVSSLVTAGTKTVGIRMPDHPVALALIKAAGTPIVAPSANPSGRPAPVSAKEVIEYFNGKIDMILDAGTSHLQTASTVVDMTVSPPRILRQGTISQAEIEDVIAR